MWDLHTLWSSYCSLHGPSANTLQQNKELHLTHSDAVSLGEVRAHKRMVVGHQMHKQRGRQELTERAMLGSDSHRHIYSTVAEVCKVMLILFLHVFATARFQTLDNFANCSTKLCGHVKSESGLTSQHVQSEIGPVCALDGLVPKGSTVTLIICFHI